MDFGASAASGIHDMLAIPEQFKEVLGQSNWTVPSDLDVVWLDERDDLIKQVDEAIRGYGIGELGDVYLVTHGTVGAISLGENTFDASSLYQYTQQVQAWGQYFSEASDFLIYGCNVASGDQGEAFVDAWAAALDVDVAASTDATGAAGFGGDWDLEYATGSVDAALDVSALHLDGLLGVSLIGIPEWDSQGPAPVINGQVSADPDDAVSGAVEALAAHPTDANILYAGGSVGGVWKTTNATSDSPNWRPLTDQYPTLAISDLAFSPLDSSFNTLFAATGGFNNGGINGSAQGILRTTDGGETWELIGQTEFGTSRIRSVVPTAIGTSLVDQVVLAAAIDGSGGVYRSTNGGSTFSLVSGSSGASDGLDNDADGTTDEVGELNLPTGQASYLVGDPNDINRFYTAIIGQGLFRSDNGGANWVAVNNGLTLANDSIDNDGDGTIDETDGSEDFRGSTNIELAVSAAAGSPVYASLLGNVTVGTSTRTRLMGVFQTTDFGATWSRIGTAPAVTPGGQGFNDFSMVADPNNPNLVYVAGDRQASSPFVGNLFRGDAASDAWTDITDSPLSGGTAPHADSRDMVFDANGNIIEADDGGIFRLINPDGTVPILDALEWRSLNRNLTVGQFYSTPYDHADNVIFGGTQDTGSAIQTSSGSVVWDEVNLGDGGTAGVGYGSVEILGVDIDYGSVQYTMGNNFNTFNRTFTNGAVDLLFGGQLDLTGLAADDSGFTGFTVFPYEVNAFDGSRLVIGGLTQWYESADFGDNLTIITPAGAGSATAIAYGGSQGGAANQNVLYVGDSNGNLYLRTTAGGAFTQLTNYTFGAPTDIVLDPDDWSKVYVSDGGSVYYSDDMGTSWSAVNTPRLSSLTDTIRSIEIYSPTSVSGDEILLAGGTRGVFRSLNPTAGADALWSEFGWNLPNAPVADIQYDATDDILVTSAYGRGVWALPSASSFLPVQGVLEITGDTDFSGQDDVITLRLDEFIPNQLNVYLNNLTTPELSTPVGSVQQINVFGLGGNDTLIVDSSFGLIDIANGIRYDGGSGSDMLKLLQTSGTTRTSSTYNVGPNNGQGVIEIEGGPGSGSQVVSFENLEPVLDLVPATTLTVNATNGTNAISYTTGSVVTNGLLSVDSFEPIEFANKSNLVINALGGSDTISINNNITPAALTSITVNGGDPGSGDALTIAGAGGAVTVNTATSSIIGATGTLGAVNMTYSGIESLALTGGVTALTLTTTGADDTLTVTPGASGAANSGTLVSSGSVPSLSFVNSGIITANLGGGSDAVTVNATDNADTIAVDATAVAITGRNAVNYNGVESVTVNGRAGTDVFTVTPSAVAVSIDGGDPKGSLPGDLLNIIAGGQSVTYNAGPETDEGSFDVGTNAAVSFDHIESFGISGSGPATINGTNGPDAITVIARDSSTHGAANGVQDFTVSVNTGPELLFINVASLVINSKAGSDEITLLTPAPNNAVWDVSVSVDGGPAATADSDRLKVQTPSAAAEMVTYTPGSANSGVLDLTSLSSDVTITDIESIAYDGQNDNDNLTVLATGGDDTIVHMPGATDQSGSFTVNGLLALSYQNMGPTATLTVDGAGGADTLVLYGSATNDAFSVAANGAVSLNARLAVRTANNETLTLEGLGGDDSFTLLPALSASVFTTMNFNGGGQASNTGDRVSLVGADGDDAFLISGQTVTLGGKTMAGTGIENIQLDAKGGTNRITYTGVEGVTENITVGSAGTAGAGQISVPSVTLVNFKGVQFISVIGNTPTATETDTLTFSGTNAADLFNIKLQAEGSDADPVLKLQSTASSTLLTLSNYTNFDTLRINGLDGADTFNAYTADSTTTPDRFILIDGGAPTAKKKSTDKLNVYYTGNRPRIIQSTATQDPITGLVDLFYPTRHYLVQYTDIELTTIRKI